MREEPTRPVSEYCGALRQYGQVLSDCADAGEAGPFGSVEQCREVADALFMLDVASGKSNLLYRLIYQGQELRTRKCPEHKGHWSGWAWEANECECQNGPDLTGWLPNDED